MSQRSVEHLIGRLATDEEFRRRFQEDRNAVIGEAIASGLALTPVEIKALVDIDFSACQRFARCLDGRLQKISFRKPVTRRNHK